MISSARCLWDATPPKTSGVNPHNYTPDPHINGMNTMHNRTQSDKSRNCAVSKVNAGPTHYQCVDPRMNIECITPSYFTVVKRRGAGLFRINPKSGHRTFRTTKLSSDPIITSYNGVRSAKIFRQVLKLRKHCVIGLRGI